MDPISLCFVFVGMCICALCELKTRWNWPHISCYLLIYFAALFGQPHTKQLVVSFLYLGPFVTGTHHVMACVYARYLHWRRHNNVRRMETTANPTQPNLHVKLGFFLSDKIKSCSSIYSFSSLPSEIIWGNIYCTPVIFILLLLFSRLLLLRAQFFASVPSPLSCFLVWGNFFRLPY